MNKQKLSLLVGAIFMSTGGAVQALDLTAYTFPDSRYDEAFLEGQFSANDGNQDQTSYNMILDLNFDSVLSTLPRTYDIGLSGHTDLSRGKNDGDRTQDNTFLDISGKVDTYFNQGQNQEKRFWFGSGDIRYSDKFDDLFAKAGIGLGYGRIINATPLAKAIRAIEELREHGVILGDVSDQIHIDLARIIDREREFRSKFGGEEYKSKWYSELEAALKKSGSLKNDALGASGTLHMDRVLGDVDRLGEAISVRKHGWVVRGGVGVVLQDFNGNSGDPSLDLEWEYANPIGLQSQFTNTLKYSTILADDTGSLLSNNMSYTYELSDRIDWENTWLASLDIRDDRANDLLTNSLASSFLYYLTNRLNARFTVAATSVEDDIVNDNDDLALSAFGSLRYRLK